MSKKNKLTYYSYMEGNLRYMSCMVCGRYEQVGEEATAVKCSHCVVRMIPLEKPAGYKPTGRPAGWHWRKEFVDTDGTVYHLGKEQPKLKGTLKPTKVSPPKKKKIKRRTKQQMLLAMDAERKVELKKAHQKQKDFINHNIDKG
jgi:DNA-directed RNA polymerase subunit RPC12/RpoP